jgi:pantoate--beta-alanine ligase
MLIINTIPALRQQLQLWRAAGEQIALVPTMGNLHAGHLTLIQQAQAQAARVVVSIFVNPTQFGPNEDFASYPRTLAADQQHLEQLNVDLLFLPEVATLYPEGACTRVEVGQLATLHCGASRPGHFSGVATIVTKLFNLVQPDKACFGAKDFQQLSIIRQMVRDLDMPIDILSVPTVREADGLAMSSRNGYLTPEQRALAPKLYQSLQAAHAAILAGDRDYAALQQQQIVWLQSVGFTPDYFVVCKQVNLQPATLEDKELVILVAAKLGKPRLIDNLSFSLSL